MSVKHFLSVANLGPNVFCHLIETAIGFARGDKKIRALDGKIVGIYFKRTSTRTRTAFTVGALKLGAQTISYGPNDLQVVTGETMRDTGKVLSGFVDILVVRTNDALDEMEALADQNEMAVINAMSENEHPTQAIADLVTIRDVLGRLDDVHVLYIGEGNNSASALALAVAQIPGMRLTVVTPEGYGLPDDLAKQATALAQHYGADFVCHHDLERLPVGVDVVYTTRWLTMGVPKTDPDWMAKFEPYRVTQQLMERVSKPSGTIFLHDLPAMRGREVVDEVLDGAQSRAFLQARHKLTSAMSIMSWCKGKA